MIAQMKRLHFFNLALSLFIIGLLSNPLNAADKEYIEVKIDGEIVGKWMELASIDEYDSAGNTVRTKTYGDYSYYEFRYEYNAKGQKIHYIYSKGHQQTGESYKNETWYTYDKKGNNVEEWNERDKHGNVIRTIVKRNGKLEEVRVHILEYHKNSEILKKDTCYYTSNW